MTESYFIYKEIHEVQSIRIVDFILEMQVQRDTAPGSCSQPEPFCSFLLIYYLLGHECTVVESIGTQS